MARIFLSHSSTDNAPAIALRDWLVSEGWSDLFLDLDPERGIAAGERWEQALNEAARRCEVVLFLISRAWLSSKTCLGELNLARRLNKRLFGVLIEEGLGVDNLPPDLTATWQYVDLASGRDHTQFHVTLPITGEKFHVTFSLEGLARLKRGLQRAGLHASYFQWPPDNDPDRPPYRGLRPLEADDAGIFFGREAPVIEAIDRLRGLRENIPPRMLVILGASGAGKSSFLRAGLLPRLARDDISFHPLPVIRPERAAISGETGLLNALVRACEAAGLKTLKADLRAAIAGGAEALKPHLQAIAEAVTPTSFDDPGARRSPMLILAIDQGEELFLADADEAKEFLRLLRGLIASDNPAVAALFTIRSDNYERLQEASELDGVHQETLSLPPMPKGSYADVVKGPLRRLDGSARAIRLDDALTEALLADIEAGGAKDALPLLAFTLERLYGEYHAGGHLKLEHYEMLGRVKGSIEAAVERALQASNASLPRDRAQRLALLRLGLIPWLAGIDPETGAPRRRVARQAEIPAAARPLVDLLVEQRLLSTDVAKDTGETTIEPAHEALLRQWGQLQSWLKEDTGLLTILDGIKRAARDWTAHAKARTWLAHSGGRLNAAENLSHRADLAASLDATDRAYLAACRMAEVSARRRSRAARAGIGGLAVGLAALVGWINQDHLTMQYRAYAIERPFVSTQVAPHVLKPEQERALKPGHVFRECDAQTACPDMVAVRPGQYRMGSPAGEDRFADEEGEQREVTISRPFAVSKFEVTYREWSLCARVGDCPSVAKPIDVGDAHPVVNVSWNDAERYVSWLARITGQPYRLLSEAEWEYAARAGSTARFSFGDEASELCKHANGYDTSRPRADTTQETLSCNDGHANAAAVGQYLPNAFGLYDMHGNVWEWVEDCWSPAYAGAPNDGSAYVTEGCERRVARGGAFDRHPKSLRAANRYRAKPADFHSTHGIRVARSLLAPG